MTKFEVLEEIIARKKNKNSQLDDIANKEELEVADSESTKTALLSCGDDNMDMDLIDQLYRKPRYKPNEGTDAASWGRNLGLR